MSGDVRDGDWKPVATPPPLAVPTIHLNGTSRDALIDQLREAVHAIHEAGTKLAAACPNARDYYVQAPGAIMVAQAQHEARMAKLRGVATDLESIAEAIFAA